ncbi:unnamed protein product, partial [Choristocarpus tenellus]
RGGWRGEGQVGFGGGEDEAEVEGRGRPQGSSLNFTIFDDSQLLSDDDEDQENRRSGSAFGPPALDQEGRCEFVREDAVLTRKEGFGGVLRKKALPSRPMSSTVGNVDSENER